jgi:hypothetical protein
MLASILKIVNDKIQEDQNNGVKTEIFTEEEIIRCLQKEEINKFSTVTDEIVQNKCQYRLKRGPYKGKYCGHIVDINIDNRFCSGHIRYLK